MQLELNKMSESRNRPGPVVDAVKTTHNILMLFCFILLCKGTTIFTSLATHKQTVVYSVTLVLLHVTVVNYIKVTSF